MDMFWSLALFGLITTVLLGIPYAMLVYTLAKSMEETRQRRLERAARLAKLRSQ